MSEELRHVSVWKIWANPIFLRFVRSRLRPAALATWIVVILTIAAFLYFFTYFVSHYRFGATPSAAARDAFFPVLFTQMMILLLMGTGGVASGITREADDGMIDYQRLTPMTPLAKIVGYLFGLPIREYVLFAVTVPFTVYSIVKGGIPLGAVAELYFVLFVSAILYHLTGCVAGTVVKRRRFAGRVAQVMVVLLYFVLPNLSGLGFVFFEYLTMRPVLFEQISSIKGPLFNRLPFPEGVEDVLLFAGKMSKLQFSLLIQCALIVVFLVILYRKWRQPTNHVLGKSFALFTHLAIIVLLLGNALPMIEDGQLFRSGRFDLGDQELQRRFGDDIEQLNRVLERRNEGRVEIAYALASALGLGILALTFGMTSIVTPTSEEHTRALRRARKLDRKRIPHNADGATGLWHALGFGIIGAAAWSILVRHVFQSAAVPQFDRDERWMTIVPAGIVLYTMVYHAVLERFGKRALMLFSLFLWIVPLLASLILVAAKVKVIPALLAGFSGFASPFYLLVLALRDEKMLEGTERVMQRGSAFSLFAHFLLLIFLCWSLSRHKKRIRTQVYS